MDASVNVCIHGNIWGRCPLCDPSIMAALTPASMTGTRTIRRGERPDAPPKDPAAIRQGRSNLRAGKDAERAVAAAYGGVRTGHFGGPDDVIVGELFIIQSKAGKAWFRKAYVDELRKLPRSAGRVPTLVVSSRPGPGRPIERYVVRLLEDDIALHGDKP